MRNVVHDFGRCNLEYTSLGWAPQGCWIHRPFTARRRARAPWHVARPRPLRFHCNIQSWLRVVLPKRSSHIVFSIVRFFWHEEQVVQKTFDTGLHLVDATLLATSFCTAIQILGSLLTDSPSRVMGGTRLPTTHGLCHDGFMCSIFLSYRESFCSSESISTVDVGGKFLYTRLR
jgi:hypothetical protein